MILDNLTNAERYISIHSEFRKAFEFLKNADTQTLKEKYDIDGKTIFALSGEGPGRREEEAELEAHRKYIDIQYVIEGTDRMGWSPTASCTTISKEYDLEKDIMFYSDKPECFIPVKQGMFAVFFPEDAHMPMISDGNLRKLIVKIMC